MPKKVIFTDRVMRPIAHFSHAVRVGDVIHLGATAGTDAERRLNGSMPGMVDVEVQTRQMFENVSIVLGLLGASREQTIKVKTYITDVRDIPAYMAIYNEVLGDIAPNHVVVASNGFPLPQAAIELDLLATVGAPIARIRSADGAVSAGDRYFCSAGSSDAGPFATQAISALNQLGARLAEGGRRINDVVYLHASLADCRDVLLFADSFSRFFGDKAPACTVVVAPLADPHAMLQLEAIAADGGGQPVSPAGLPRDGSIGTPAMLVGDELYIGGQLGIGPDGSLPSGVEAQTRAAWKQVGALLDAVGMTGQSILRTNNVLTDWRNYAGFNAGYGANVVEPYPPRATVLGGLRHRDALIQVEAVAHRFGSDATIVQVP